MDLDEIELKATRKLLGLDKKENKQQKYDDNDYLIAREECIEYNNVEEDINELKILLFQDRLTSYGKRKMVDYYESEIERQKKINKELEKYEQMYLDEVDKRVDVVLLYNSLLNKIKYKIEVLKQEYDEILSEYGNLDTDVIINVPNKNVRKYLDKLVAKIQVLQELLQEENK